MKIIRWIVALTVSFFGIWFALRGVQWADLVRAISGLKAPGWLLLTLPTVFIVFSGRTIRWCRILSAMTPDTPWKTYFPVTAAGFFLNTVLPFRAGEVARVAWTRSKSKLPVSSVVSVLVVERVLDMMTLLTFLLLILWQKSDLIPNRAAIGVLATGIVGGFGVLIFMSRCPDLVKKMWLFRKLPTKVQAWAGQFMDGASVLRDTRAFLGLYAVSCFFWAVDIGFCQIAGRLFSLPLSWIDAAWLMSAFCVGAALPSAPGYVGTLEASGVAALSLLGYAPEVSFPFVLTLHGVQMMSTVFWGLPAAISLGAFQNRDVIKESTPEVVLRS